MAGLLSVTLSGGAALAQSQNTYGLSDLKPYDGARVAAPAGNDLDRVVRAEKSRPAPASASSKNLGNPVFTIHAVGGVMIESTIRR